MNDHDQPLALREMDREAAVAHYRFLIDRLSAVRLRTLMGPHRRYRLAVRSQLAARVALTDLEGRR